MGVDTFVALSVEATVARTLQVVLALGGAYLIALWFVLIVWTYRDIESRSRNVLTQVLSTSLVVLFWVPGALLYLILRPKETLDSSYQRSLEEEYLLQDLEELPHCPSCERFIEDDFLLCPHCHTRLREPCLACARLIDLRWSICPYCGAAQGGEAVETPATVEAPAARWRANTRRRTASEAAAATVAVEPAGEDAVAVQTAAVADELPGASEYPSSAPQTGEVDATKAATVPEPIPLMPVPRGRFRRPARPASGQNGQGSSAALESSDQVPVSSLFTSILGARGVEGTAPSSNGKRIHRVPDPARPASQPATVDGQAEPGAEMAGGPDAVATGAESPADVVTAAQVAESTEGELVAVRAEGKGD